MLAETILPMEKMESTNLERFGTITAWASTLGVSEKVVRKRLQDAQGITGKLSSGQILKECFYAESTIRQACIDLFQDFPCADEHGFFIRTEGEQTVRYGTKNAWAKFLGVSSTTLQKYLEGTQGTDGRTCTRVLMRGGFYSETTMRECYPHGFDHFAKTDSSGFFIHEKKRYGTVKAWAKEWQIDGGTIQRHTQGKEDLLTIDGKGTQGKVCLYEENTLKKALEDFFQVKFEREQHTTSDRSELSKADASGFFSSGEEKYGTRAAWGRMFNVSAGALKDGLNAPRLGMDCGLRDVEKPVLTQVLSMWSR